MKHLSRILLLLGLALVLLTATSCVAVTEQDIEEDPVAVLTEAMENTSHAVATDEAGLLEILRGAFKDGSLSITLEKPEKADEADSDADNTGLDRFDELTDGLLSALTSVTEILYFSADNGITVSETHLIAGEHRYTPRLFLSQEAVTVHAPELLGTDTAYTMPFEKLNGALADTDLGTLLGWDKAMLDTYAAQRAAALEETKTDYKALLRSALTDILSRAELSVERGVGRDLDGKPADCFILTWTVDNDSLRAIFTVVEDLLTESLSPYVDEEAIAALSEGLDRAYNGIHTHFRFHLSISAHLTEADNTLSGLDMEGSLVPRQEGVYEKMEMEGHITIAADRINGRVDLFDEDESHFVELSWEKDDNKATADHSLELAIGSGATSLDVLKLSYSYEKENGAFALDAAVALSPDDEPQKLTLAGVLSVKKRKAFTLTLDRLMLHRTELPLAVTIEAKVKAVPPSPPRDPVDITTCGKEELEGLLRHLEDAFAELSDTAYLSGTYTYTPPYSDDPITLRFSGSSLHLSYVLFSGTAHYVYDPDAGTLTIDVIKGGEEFGFLNGTYPVTVYADALILDGVRYNRTHEAAT